MLTYPPRNLEATSSAIAAAVAAVNATIDDLTASDIDYLPTTVNSAIDVQSAVENTDEYARPSELDLAALPTGGDIVTGQLVRLTAADSTAKAGPGLYMHDGTAWACLQCAEPYAWGNLGATPTTALIAGCDYVFTRDQEITGWTLTLSRPGVCNWTLTGAFACADPTCTGRTFGERETTWSDNIVSALIEGAFRDDGTRMICSAVELNT